MLAVLPYFKYFKNHLPVLWLELESYLFFSPGVTYLWACIWNWFPTTLFHHCLSFFLVTNAFTLCFPPLSTVYLYTWLWFTISFLHFPCVKLFQPGCPASWKTCSCPTLPEILYLSVTVHDSQRLCDHKSQNLDVYTSLDDNISW